MPCIDFLEQTPEQPPRVTVTLPPGLVAEFPGATSSVQLLAASVGELVTALDRRWPGMGDRLCDGLADVRRDIAIFVDGRRAGLATALTAGAAVQILSSALA